ncbi:MAG: hypothetical protein R2773_00800 [Flavobacteriaceae bacterium]
MQKKFFISILLFFLPVIVCYTLVEWLTRGIPSTYAINQKVLETKPNSLETIVLGSSQLMNAVNAEWISVPTINLASGNQHHDTDFKLLKGVSPQLKQLKTVVLEVSYSHFELPHNGPEFWKNAVYLEYYNVNCYERFTYFKDRLLYLSNPSVFSRELVDHYVNGKYAPQFNEAAFNAADMYGQFERENYDLKTINAMKTFKINTTENSQIFKTNASLYFKLLKYIEKQGWNVVICTTPTYTTYLHAQNPNILKRRDSILEVTKIKYPNARFLLKESDTLNYQIKDFWNQSHLSPSGAKKFSQSLDSLLHTMR